MRFINIKEYAIIQQSGYEMQLTHASTYKLESVLIGNDANKAA